MAAALWRQTASVASKPAFEPCAPSSFSKESWAQKLSSLRWTPTITQMVSLSTPPEACLPQASTCNAKRRA
eukprot:CAMPEP_0115706676 /NCGR_PEP_ID=MMETSP0272-20121206/70931_1 /TAXON_ID=71861 /ORGANISM="Scrippsiella trochoidea, Strain CCMP3099" /LENGTH=70 /DNA_ID=CAMNT_0003147967 /DNA_START=25 /DNA_END=234 /DNA_ORIENTATION=-